MAEVAQTGGPDWQAIKHDVLCPLCEYNLRGLSEGRCPECGYRFEWDVITDPAARPHPYLFEHHPERNFRSFFRTLCGTLRPVKFWLSLSPMQPSRPNRLVIYAVICSISAMMAVVGVWYWSASGSWSQASARLSRISRYSFIRGTPVPPTKMQSTLPQKWQIAKDVWGYDRGLRALLVYAGLWLLWPWLTLMSLSLFQISMQRAKIKGVHVLRCVVYSYDVGAWVGLGIGSLAAISLAFSGSGPSVDGDFARFMLLVLLTIGSYRMWTAYRIYLRFDHAFWTILASQVMVFLCALIFYLDWERMFIGR